MLKEMRSKAMRIANRLVGQGKARAEAMLTAWRIIRYKALRTKISGTSFDNLQNVLQLLCKYNPADVTVKLRRETDNAFDRNAVAVIAAVKGKVSAVIGYLSKAVASVIAALMDKGVNVSYLTFHKRNDIIYLSTFCVGVIRRCVIGSWAASYFFNHFPTLF